MFLVIIHNPINDIEYILGIFNTQIKAEKASKEYKGKKIPYSKEKYKVIIQEYELNKKYNIKEENEI